MRLTVWVRVVVATVFVVSAVLKLATPAGTPAPSDVPRLVQVLLRPEAGYVVALVELLVAVSLFTRHWRAGMWSTLVLSVVFLAFLRVLQSTGVPSISCGCLGSVPLDGRLHAALVLGLSCAALGALLTVQSSPGTRPAVAGPESMAR